jgi:serine phosphatase RsbU (regulator of sigma subunit)
MTKKRFKFPISAKITLPYVLLALIFAMASAYIVTTLVFENIETRFQDQLLASGEIAADLIVNQDNELLAVLRSISYTEGFSEHMLNGDAEAIREIILPIAINQGVEAIEVLDSSGLSLLSMHKTGEYLEDYSSERGSQIYLEWDLVTSVLNQLADINNEKLSNKFADYVEAPWGDFFYVAGPAYAKEGDFAGAILVGISIDTFSERLKNEIAVDVISFYGIDSRLIHTTYSLFGQQEPLTKDLAQAVFESQEVFSFIRPTTEGSVTFSEVLGTWQIRNGEDIGIFGLSRVQSETISAGTTSRFLILGIAALFFILIVFVGLFVSRLITQPLNIVMDGISTLESGDLDVSLPVTGNDELTHLSSAFNEMVTGLKTKERMQTELNFARDIQTQMMPVSTFDEAEQKGITLKASLDPAREIGGDFYDFFFIDEHHLCFVIGDVSGKGAPGAMLMAVAKTLIRSRAMNDLSTGSILTYVNQEINRGNESAMFVTVFLCILNIETGVLTYTNAAHNPPYLKTKSGVLTRLDKKHGLMVGPFPVVNYKEDFLKLAKGDVLLLYTDGVSEAMDINDNLFTEKRIAEIFTGFNEGTISQLIDTIVDEVATFQGEAEQADDITLLALSF